jgi:outer membrane protein assembly complex protein YaeT
MALLLTGRVVDNAQAAEAEGARQQMVALLAGSLTGRISQQFQQTFGLSEVRLEPDLISPEQNPTARLTIGQNLTRKLSLVYSMDLSNAGNQIWIAEYDITRRFMTQAVKQEDNSYRLEFRHDKRFGGTPFEPISRGPAQRHVGKVTFSGNTYFTEQQLQRAFKVKTGQKYDYFHVRKGLDSLGHLYAKQDMLETRIQLHRDQHGDRVDLDVHITPGPRVSFVFEGWDPPRAARDHIRNIWQQGVFEAQRSDEADDAIQEALLKENYLKGTVKTDIQNLEPASRRVLFEIQPGVRYQSVKYVFDGAKAVDSDDLIKVIKKAKLENAVYTRPDEVSQALVNYYRDQGFLTTEVGKSKLDLDPESRSAKVVIPITEGPKYRVGKITFDGNTIFKPDYLLDQIALTEGEEYTPELREQSYTRLQDLFWGKGYNDAEISYALRPRQKTDLVDVAFQVKENKQRVVKSIEISGNDHTSQNLVSTQLAFHVGDVLTNEKMSRSRVNLYITGAFVLVDIATKDLPEQGSGLPANQRPVAVDVNVHEVQPYQIRYGGFYDTERGPGAIADFTTYNTLGAARSLGLRLRYDSQIKEARLYFSQPYLRRFPIKTNFVVYGETDTTPAYKVERIGASIQEEARWSRHYILSFGYRFEHTITRGASPDPLFPFAVTARIAPLTATFTRETRDDFLNPTRGSFLTQALEYAPSWLGSQLRYARYYGQYYRYVPLHKPVDIPFASTKKPRLVYAGAVRLGLAYGFGGQDIIPSERFYAGGGTTIRGFQQDFVGPVVAGVPTGGEAELIINNELRFPLWKWFDGVAFMDIGNVYQHVQDFRITDLRKAGGLGLRLRTPYVLLRLDYGVKLDRRSGESFGQLFFSIGQAF